MKSHTLKSYLRIEPSYDYDRTGSDNERSSRIANVVVGPVPRKEFPVDIVKVPLGKNPTQWGLPKHVPTLMEKYAIDRLFRMHKVYDSTKWTVDVTRGYYGDEIGDVSFNGKSDFLEDVDNMLKLQQDSLAIVKFVLLREYSYLIDAVRDATGFGLIWIDPGDLRHNNDYMTRVKRFEVDDYEIADIDLPIGVVYQGKFLVDGYHRAAKIGPGETRPFINLT
ncbi:hypothetical protein Xoosp13_130 [Xanthomonas phage Xoo-sp13]|nr:hypothetical protein Xoosp13_130 [Xanthomonas phage Xoo-sp13]